MAYSKDTDGRKRNAEYQRKWYAQNKAKQMERTAKQKKKRAREIQIFLCEYLTEHPCSCGEDDIVVMDFDHVRGEKIFDLSQAATLCVSQQKLEEEIAKCDVLCRNCHHRRHAHEKQWYRVKFLAGNL